LHLAPNIWISRIRSSSFTFFDLAVSDDGCAIALAFGDSVRIYRIAEDGQLGRNYVEREGAFHRVCFTSDSDADE